MKLFLMLIGLALLLLVLPAVAQPAITDDEINDIAAGMYCPVCENIPLEACGTAACDDWRNEIRLYLEQGWSEQEIIDDFVVRFGDRVVGVPQDPTLRALSLVTPWLVAGLALVGVAYMLWRRTHGRGAAGVAVSPTEVIASSNSDYHNLLDQDLKG
jgi:cytochrome c-type biogenesis protein CcmH